MNYVSIFLQSSSTSSSSPTRLPPGDTHKDAREKKVKELADVRMAAKAERPVEKNGDVDHQMKKVRVDGMRSQVEKNIVKWIVSQINVMRDNAEITNLCSVRRNIAKKLHSS